MNKRIGALVLGPATLAACVDAPEPSEPQGAWLETSRGGPVNGSNFECTGTWPHGWNPCNYPWSTQSATFASGSDGLVTLRLGRNLVPNDYEGYPIEPAGSFVFLYLDFNTPDDTVRTSAREMTFISPGDVRIVETSDPVSGWINPIVLSPDPDGRNAGKFSLTFTWGGIRGTYDTGAPAP